MRFPPRAVPALTALVLVASACSSGSAAIGQALASIVVPVPASAVASPSPSPVSSSGSAAPPVADTPVAGGRYVGTARLARTDLAGVSREAQPIHWALRPRCSSPNCPLQLISKSGGFTVLLRRSGASYRGSTRRPPGFFRCAGTPERVTLRIELRPAAGTLIGGRWVATRVTASLRNVSVPSPTCRRSYLITTVAAARI